MSASSIYCAACGLQNPREAAFCNGCGARLTLPADPEHPAKTLGRDILTETGKEVTKQVIVTPLAGGIAGVVFFVLTAVGAFLGSLWLGAQNTARSTPSWFLLTWPLTLASAAIVLLARRSLKGSLAIVPAGAIIVVAAAWLGATISGVAYYTSPSPYAEEPATSFIGVALGMLGRMLEIYGTDAFVMAIITGAVVGLIVDRVVPEGITQAS